MRLLLGFHLWPKISIWRKPMENWTGSLIWVMRFENIINMCIVYYEKSRHKYIVSNFGFILTSGPGSFFCCSSYSWDTSFYISKYIYIHKIPIIGLIRQLLPFGLLGWRFWSLWPIWPISRFPAGWAWAAAWRHSRASRANGPGVGDSISKRWACLECSSNSWVKV